MEIFFHELLKKDVSTQISIFKTMFDRITDYIFIMKWDQKRKAFIYLYVNEQALYDLDLDYTILDKSFEQIFPDRADFLNEKYHEAIRTNQTVMYEEKVITKKGEFIGETALNPIFFDHGESIIVFSIVRDVTDRKKAEEQANVLAYQDDLTGLWNRRYFKKALDELIQSSRENYHSFSLIIFDLDNFKMINDHFGHDVGDEILQGMASRLKSVCSNELILCRIGGDEVGILCPNKTIQQTEEITKSLLEAFQLPIETRSHSIPLDVSIGVAVYPIHAQESLALIKASDISLYYVKKNGKNNWLMFSDDLGKCYFERASFEQALKEAVLKKDFTLHYQPRINAKTGKIQSVEALIRWDQATPDVFIPIAEETGLIHEIGYWVTKTACEQLKKWQEKGFPIEKVSVNLSLHQLQQGTNCTEAFSNIISETGVSPSNLEFEITERFISLEESMINCLRKMKALGISISIDDFGKEYSSLWCIRKLPIDSIKLDRSFLEELTTDETVEVIVETILSLSKALNLRVVGEGIETKKQAEKLTQLGIDEMQGYLFSKPLPPEQLEEFLHNQIFV